jgi:hypothetical protein
MVAVLIVGACGPAPATQIPDDFRISLERGPCFGACPIYSLSVSADGSVVYEGTQFVEVEGRQTASLTQAQVRTIVDAVLAIDFFDLDDRYEAQATDLPSMTIEVTMQGEAKNVYHYGLACGSDFDPAPTGLCELEALLEEIPASNGWISSELLPSVG